MKVGVSKAKITPSVGSALSGYRARSGVSTGIHDDLYCRAIALESGGDAAILISVDVLALSSAFAAKARERISKATNVPSGNILVAATHTHSGPHTIQTFFNADAALDAHYMSELESAIAECGVNAWNSRMAARVGVGHCQVAGLGANRRNPARGEVDREAAIIRADRADGSLMAVALVYGCHPTVLGVGNLEITGDFPAAAIETLEKRAGANTFAMFFNGAEGDVSIGRSSELSAIGVQTRGRTFKRAWELGERLALAVLHALPDIRTFDATVIKVARKETVLQGRRLPGIDELKLAAEQARARAQRIAPDAPASMAKVLIEDVYAEARYNNARTLERQDYAVPITVTGIRVGNAVFLGVPAEVFTETGLAIKAAIHKKMFVIGLANGYIGYLPAKPAYGEGGYEVEVALCAPDSEQRLMRAALELKELLLPNASGLAEKTQ